MRSEEMNIPTKEQQENFKKELEAIEPAEAELKKAQGIWRIGSWKYEVASQLIDEARRQDNLKLKEEANKIARKANRKAAQSFWLSVVAIIIAIISLIHKW